MQQALENVAIKVFEKARTLLKNVENVCAILENIKQADTALQIHLSDAHVPFWYGVTIDVTYEFTDTLLQATPFLRWKGGLSEKLKKVTVSIEVGADYAYLSAYVEDVRGRTLSAYISSKSQRTLDLVVFAEILRLLEERGCDPFKDLEAKIRRDTEYIQGIAETLSRLKLLIPLANM